MLRTALLISAFLALTASTALATPIPEASKQKVEFARDVQPIFAAHCIKCHGPEKQKAGFRLDQKSKAMQGGDSGPVIQPKKGAESLLIQLVANAVPDDPKSVMPPKGNRLTPKQIGILRAWIDQGADWPDGLDNDAKIMSRHWSLQPLKQTAPPAAPGTWAQNEIDRFILARLNAKELKPADQAGRVTLIRRLSYDLIGLPPTPGEIDAFVTDKDPRAYQKLVDRLLASPHYGERWARHWLDIVRFGESHGFEYNQPRNNAWHYRNWVINALNDDMPYDRFVRMQLAGDLLASEDATMVAATGFLVAGPHNTTLPSSQKMRMSMQQDEYEDLVGTIGQAFLGLTVNCARCHSHKFDPITQREYYSFVAAVAGVTHGERKVDLTEDQAERKARINELEGKRRSSVKQLASIDKIGRKNVLATRKAGVAPKPKAPQPVARWEFEGNLKDSIGSAHGEALNGATVENGALVVDGKKAYVRTANLSFALKAKTLEAWVKLDNLNQRGGGAITVQTPGGGVFDSIVFAERESQRWMAGSNSFVRYASFKAPTESEANKRFVHVAIVYKADGTIIGYRDGKQYGSAYRSRGLQTFAAGKTNVIFGLRHETAGGNRQLSARIDRAALYDRALSPDEVAASTGAASDYVPEPQLIEALTAEQRKKRQALKKQIQSIDVEMGPLRAASRPISVYAVKPRNPGVSHVLRRGNVADRGAVALPSGLAAVPSISADFELKADAPDSQRRAKLAKWIANNKNPLFARVIVNRLWHYHFGIGLVDTPSDFGVNGGRPSHPQLLEWLATQMIARHWSLKQMHRLMVTSATYRQSSKSNGQALKKDANNRLLWRMSPRRLEGEAIRDAMLSVTGMLNPTVGGVGYRDVREYKFKGSHFYDPIEPTGDQAYRRTIYRFTPRGAKKNMLDTFDCPDPSAAAPKRAVTTTPLQALTLMNNPFVLNMAKQFALRLKNDAADNIDGQIQRAYRLAYGRVPDKAELDSLRPFVTKHGLDAFCRVIFNSNEFLYVQ